MYVLKFYFTLFFASVIETKMMFCFVFLSYLEKGSI